MTQEQGNVWYSIPFMHKLTKLREIEKTIAAADKNKLKDTTWNGLV